MVVGSTTLNRTVHLSNIIRAQYSTGRISLPQSGGLYSRFKHIQGVPATGAETGFPVSKLRMIDVLVERLVQLKGRSYPLEAGQGETDTDALIQKFSTDLAQSLRKAESVSRSMTAGLAHAGMLFDLVA